MPDIFNDYDANGYRRTTTGSRSSRTEDNAIIYNLRFRWKSELEKYNDIQIINAYDQFALSDWFGNNDERFLDWIEECYRGEF